MRARTAIGFGIVKAPKIISATVGLSQEEIDEANRLGISLITTLPNGEVAIVDPVPYSFADDPMAGKQYVTSLL
jgi:hypothetical protein